MRLLKFIVIIFSLFIMISLTACGGGGDESSSSMGTLSLKLTDATTNDYKAVYVTIKEVQVCTDDENDGDENSWYTVAEPERTYNLLELVNGVQEQLGVTDLDAGHYNQMRLIIGTDARDGHPYANYIVMVDDENNPQDLKIPSGIQTGIKLVSGFEIYENQTTELILDFDAARSVVKAGNSGQWLLKPTIKVIGTAIAISGTVTDDKSNPLADVLVSAQEYDSDGDDVIVHASTITNENGEYVLFVEPYVYNLVAYGEGYAPQCSYIEVIPDFVYAGENFVLTPASVVETLSGGVTVVTDDDDAYVSISVRQLIECEQEIEIKIEVLSFNIADGHGYSVDLPVGSYEIVAKTAGYEAQVDDEVEISGGFTTTRDIIFE